MDVLVPARPLKDKSEWDRNAALQQMTQRSAAHERLYSDANAKAYGMSRSAKANRERQEIMSARPEPTVKPEGFDLSVSQQMSGKTSRRDTVKYREKGPEIASKNDDYENEKVNKKQEVFGTGHPMWSPYYRPKGKTADGKPIIPINYFKQSSRDVGSFKTDPTLVELGPKMMKSNANLAINIKAELQFNPYPHHLNVTPRNTEGRNLVSKKNFQPGEMEAMHTKFFVTEKPPQNDEFKEKFTRIMYDQAHKKVSTTFDQGSDPFKLSKEQMFKMKNEAKYGSRFVGPCFDMGALPNWNYNEYHGAAPGLGMG